jgi:hypothetical protein
MQFRWETKARESMNLIEQNFSFKVVSATCVKIENILFCLFPKWIGRACLLFSNSNKIEKINSFTMTIDVQKII